MPKKYRLSGLEIRNLSLLNGGQAGKPSSPAGRRVHGRFFSLLVAPIRGDHAKCATVVSKKVSAKAVERNTVKRRARNALAKRMAGVHKPVALVFSAKRDAKSATFAELDHDIDVLFSKL